MIAALRFTLGLGAAPHGTVVTDVFWSQSLGTNKSVVVYLPPSYGTSPTRRYPVAYYLHGALGKETNWTQMGHIDAVMDSLVAAGGPEMIVVMPDGDDSWYTTWNTLITFDACRKTAPVREAASTYCVPWQHYDDYIARDLVQYADNAYRTQPAREHRAIAGLSMGGYGAVALSLEYPEVFSAAASHSGTLAPLYTGPASVRWAPAVGADDGAALEVSLTERRFWPLIFPAFGRDTAGWWSRDPGRRLERLVAKKGRTPLPALFADCGTQDGFIGQNRVFKSKADQLGVAIVYHEWPGAHDWTYWTAHVGESLHWIATKIAQ